MSSARTELANAIRALSMDAVQKANSGHPGAPMGLASIAFETWMGHLRYDPADPDKTQRPHPGFDTWPELWVEDESRFTEAQAFLRSILEDNRGQSWFCRGCQQENEAAFKICWNCGRAYQ